MSFSEVYVSSNLISLYKSELGKIFEGLERLRELVYRLDTRFRYAVEIRHRSWFQDLAYNFFVNNGICTVWNQLAEIQTRQ
jgi:hypothetical protein